MKTIEKVKIVLAALGWVTMALYLVFYAGVFIWLVVMTPDRNELEQIAKVLIFTAPLFFLGLASVVAFGTDCFKDMKQALGIIRKKTTISLPT